MPKAFSASRLFLLGAVGALLAPGCVWDECEFRSRCLGDRQYEWCNIGSDFKAHRAVVDCPAPNLACARMDEESTRCVYAPATRCGASFVDRCDGTRRVYCDEALGWVQAVDCVKLGSTGCHVDAALGTAVCD